MSKQALENSAKILFSNLKLFVPDLVDTAIAWGLFFVIVYYTGAFDIVALLQGATEEASIELVKQFLENNTSKLILSAITYFVVTFLVGVGVVIIKYELIKDTLNNKKTSLRVAWKNRNYFFLDVVLLRFLVTILLTLVLAVGGLLTYLSYLIVNPFNHDTAIVLSVILSIIFLIVGLLFYKFAILFRYPVMFMTKSRRAWQVLAQSIRILKKDAWFVFVTWLVIFAISLLASLIGSGISIAVSSIVGFLSLVISSSLFFVLGISFVTEIIKLVGKLWGQVYLFTRFKNFKE